MNNFDKIKSMNADKFSEWLDSIVDKTNEKNTFDTGCKNCEFNKYNNDYFPQYCYDCCWISSIKNWLEKDLRVEEDLDIDRILDNKIKIKNMIIKSHYDSLYKMPYNTDTLVDIEYNDTKKQLSLYDVKKLKNYLSDIITYHELFYMNPKLKLTKEEKIDIITQNIKGLSSDEIDELLERCIYK